MLLTVVAQLIKNLPAMQETPVISLGWNDPLEKGWATHSSTLETSLMTSIMTQLVQNLSSMQNTGLQFLG